MLKEDDVGVVTGYCMEWKKGEEEGDDLDVMKHVRTGKRSAVN